MIEYQGIEKYIYDGKILDTERIFKKIDLDRKDITIIKVGFKSKLLKLDRFQERNNKFAYTFHVFIGIEIYYLVNSNHNELGMVTESIYNSYLILDNCENSEIGNVSVTDGYIKEYPDNEFCVFIEIALVLGGYKI